MNPTERSYRSALALRAAAIDAERAAYAATCYDYATYDTACDAARTAYSAACEMYEAALSKLINIQAV